MYSSRYFLNLIEPVDIQKRAFYPKKYNLLPINKFKNISSILNLIKISGIPYFH